MGDTYIPVIYKASKFPKPVASIAAASYPQAKATTRKAAPKSYA